MIKLPYDIMRDHHFTQALAKMENHPRFPVKLALTIAKLAAAIRAQAEVVQNEFNELVKKYAFLKEDGTLDEQGKGPGTYTIKPENMQEWPKVLAEFEEKTFEVENVPLKLSDLEGVGLSPAQIGSFEMFLVEAPVALASAPTILKDAPTPAPH